MGFVLTVHSITNMTPARPQSESKSKAKRGPARAETPPTPIIDCSLIGVPALRGREFFFRDRSSYLERWSAHVPSAGIRGHMVWFCLWQGSSFSCRYSFIS